MLSTEFCPGVEVGLRSFAWHIALGVNGVKKQNERDEISCREGICGEKNAFTLATIPLATSRMVKNGENPIP